MYLFIAVAAVALLAAALAGWGAAAAVIAFVIAAGLSFQVGVWRAVTLAAVFAVADWILATFSPRWNDPLGGMFIGGLGAIVGAIIGGVLDLVTTIRRPPADRS